MKGILSGFQNDMSRRFYGDKKIETAQEDGEHVVIVFSDNTSLRIPKKLFEVSVSKESLDPTQLWDRQLPPVIKETLELWLSWDVKLEQLDYIVNLLKTSIEHNLAQANEKLWGKKTSDRRLSDVHDVLLGQSDAKDPAKTE